MSIARFSVVLKSYRWSPAIFEGIEKEVEQWITTQGITNEDAFEVYNSQTLEYMPIRDFKSKSRFVGKFYTMDPEAEDMLPNGRSLANEMVVLIGTSDDRCDISDLDEVWKIDRALKMNRWCKITHLEIHPDSSYFSFIGVYEDGTKRKWTTSIKHPWLVKLDSIGDPLDNALNLRSKVSQVVREGLEEQDRNRTVTGVNPELIETVTNEILRLL